MNKIEQIKAEIERLNNKYKYLSSIEAKHKTDCYADLLSFLDTLPEEKPSEDLEKAAEGIEGVVHHRANVHYLATNTKQLNARLKDFEEGAEVRIFINARKEDEQ